MKRLELKRVNVCVLIMVVTILFLSCTTVPVSLTSSTTPLQGKKIDKVIGKKKGEHANYAILGLFDISSVNIDKAIENALAKTEANALIDVRMYEVTYWFLLFSYNKVVIEGTAVKLIEQPKEEPVKIEKPVKSRRRRR